MAVEEHGGCGSHACTHEGIAHSGRALYTDEEIAKASEEVAGKTELEAVIAFLQSLGLALK